MKLLRKALLPAVAAGAFLGFLGIAGAASSPVTLEFDAGDGDVCQITGPLFIEEGETVKYVAVVQNPDELEIDIDLNDFDGGDSDIVGVNNVSRPEVDFVDDADLELGANICGEDDDALEQDLSDAIRQWLLSAIDRGENCGGPWGQQPFACDENAFPGHRHNPNDSFGSNLLSWQDNDIDCGLTNTLGGTCEIPGTVVTLAVNSLVKSVVSGETSCADIASAMESAILNGWSGGTIASSNYIAAQFEDYVLNYDACESLPQLEGEPDGYVEVLVSCDDPGVFDLSFAPEGNQGASIEVVCGSDADAAEIFALPNSVEINPSYANVAHSLVWVSVTGDNGEIAFPGTEVHWMTDRCAIETATVDTEDEFKAAESLFRALNPLNPATAFNVEQSVFATTAPDSASRQQEEGNTFVVTSASGTERTISAVILHCDPIHAPNVTPGVANITAFIERGDNDIDDEDLDGDDYDNDDLVVKTTVTVVGPPAANGVTVTAAPSTLACGEKATISVDVKDSIGQPVSDHTLVEAVTNAGGVLAGTGAVAGQQGLVSPVSSTVAETFGGKATLYLLTSTAHVGKYEVVVTTGGGGGVTGQLGNGGNTTNLLGGLFTTAPISVQVTVECTVPTTSAPQPTNPDTTGPNTGQGIKPPSTGNGGLK